MTKTQAKDIAKQALIDALAVAYYPLSDSGEYTDEEMELISEQMAKLGERMAKTIGERYITY